MSDRKEMLPGYYKDQLTSEQAKEEVQKLTFYPIMFQGARVLRTTGILNEVYKNKRPGISAQDVAEKLKLPYYGVNTLLEVGLTIGLFYLKKNDTYSLTKMGYFLLKDEATRVNLNFTHDVCYKAVFHLEEAIKKELPAGLKEIDQTGNDTIYPGLSQLQEQVKTSWFDFDHYYSDKAFPTALKVVFGDSPKHIIDIGGNTGKWSIACCHFNSEVKMTIVDLPGQWNRAKKNIEKRNLQDRIFGIVGDVLSDTLKLPESADAVWMSQFLDCFSEQQIVDILKNISREIDEDTSVYILETFWDRQTDLAAAFCLTGTSLYFTAVANGNSKMYHSRDMYAAIEKAGLEVVSDQDGIGEFHTLLKCRKKKS
ncbi:MAG: class I SAM-dependent methyltransferase [Flavobacteriales bacterium]|nr:class I SAM-dependent methyltransferase [Flavobacteriales bacterium]